MVLEAVLYTIGFLFLLEGLIVLLFPEKTKSVSKKIINNTKKLRNLGIIEIVIAALIILVAFLI